MMIPFRLLPLMRPVTRPVFCGMSSGSLFASRRATYRGRLSPETLARLLPLQPQRFILAMLLLVLFAVASTAVSIIKVEPTSAEAKVERLMTPSNDRIDVLDMSRWEL
jgi:hypothetical protein